MRKRARVGPVLLLLITSVALAGGCGFGDRQARAEALTVAVNALDRTEGVRGSVSAAAVVRIGASDAALPTAPNRPDELTLGVELDRRRGRAILSGGGRIVAVYDGLVVYGRRQGISEHDARPWMRLDLEQPDGGGGLGRRTGNSNRLDARSQSLTVALLALDPNVLVDFAAGALSGSIRAAVADTVGGERMTRYEGNFDFEKTWHKTRRTQYPEERRQAVQNVLDQLGITGTVHRGTAWLDDRGRLRRFMLTTDIKIGAEAKVALTLRLDLDEFDVRVEQATPRDDELLEADELLSFLLATVPPRVAPA